MNASSVWFARPGEVELRSEELPDVGSGLVGVRALASGVSAGTEMLVYRGQVAGDLELDLPSLAGTFSFPIKYGYASVGEVEEVDGQVEGMEVGDVVFVHHPHQTRYVVPASDAFRLPKHMHPELGIFLANLETAVNVMLDAAPRIGENVLIFGQGVVGLLVTGLMKRSGAGKVVTVEPLPIRKQLSREFGADEALGPDARLPEVVHDLTDGRGADLIVEASGNQAALMHAIDCAATESSIIVCSWYGTKPVELNLGGNFHRKRLHLRSSQVGTINPKLQPRWDRKRRLNVALDLLPKLELGSMITHRVPFREAATAYELLDRRPAETVQVVLTYGESDV